MMIVPMKRTEIEVKPDMYASVPVKMSIGAASIIWIRCPIYRRITVPAPMAIDDSGIVIGHIDHLRLCRFDDNLIINPCYRDIFHLRQAISFIGLLSQ